jgi:hypothetical protein
METKLHTFGTSYMGLEEATQSLERAARNENKPHTPSKYDPEKGVVVRVYVLETIRGAQDLTGDQCAGF